ncbi:transcriptional regulator [Mesorhizobium tianshanense]|uniref:DNA-binding GntR family transcriptional regulator n=1 Tax=Mesorhizobium tianshanense TaxID=39844 RepID=A0A562N4I3_9HYPH|nr:GntR family transcriptional regulator [Mesorhizobium tianshanense]TWI26771.1 DNA-binding GntR family transcriptional regulator [Mesorhizobium tianshanense]GLS36343.1 transcriptional regulator [Mesorhizobium tianshanense]
MIENTDSPRPHKGLEHKTIASAVASELRKRIVSGRFAGGFPLRQDMLANEFGISRVPIREALVLLESEGLVKIHPHRGAVVSTPSVEEIREVFELRALLEPRLLRISAPLLTAEDYSYLREVAARYVEGHRAGNIAECAELNTAFHLGLYRHAGQKKTLSIVAGLLQDSERHTRLQLSYDASRDIGIGDDARILSLCAAGRYAEACVVMKEHIEKAVATLIDSLCAGPQTG